jgi:hypothetical protein
MIIAIINIVFIVLCTLQNNRTFSASFFQHPSNPGTSKELHNVCWVIKWSGKPSWLQIVAWVSLQTHCLHALLCSLAPTGNISRVPYKFPPWLDRLGAPPGSSTQPVLANSPFPIGLIQSSCPAPLKGLLCSIPGVPSPAFQHCIWLVVSPAPDLPCV